MKRYPNDVRLVIRYAPFHSGSDKVVKLLEAAKRQDKCLPVLENGVGRTARVGGP